MSRCRRQRRHSDHWARPVYREAVVSTIEQPLPYVAPPPGRFSGFMVRMWHRTPTWTGPAAIATCFAGAAAYTLVTLDPDHANANLVPTCLVKLTTGFDCPGCGGTRAFWYLLHGNVPAAARHHAMFVFALPFLLYMYVVWAAGLVFKKRLPQLRLSPLTVGLVLGLWLVFSIARNLPWAPFTWFFV
jgi:Protein of unknown function (DUF2752)